MTCACVQVRSARLQELRAQKEYEELRQCTFTPEVHAGPPPAPVSGALALCPPHPQADGSLASWLLA